MAIYKTFGFVNFSDRANRAKSMKLKKVYRNSDNLILIGGLSIILSFVSNWAINRRHFAGISKRKADAGKDRIEQDKGWINSSNLGIEQQGKSWKDLSKIGVLSSLKRGVLGLVYEGGW